MGIVHTLNTLKKEIMMNKANQNHTEPEIVTNLPKAKIHAERKSPMPRSIAAGKSPNPRSIAAGRRPTS